MNSPPLCRRRARLPAALSVVLCCVLLPLALTGCGNKGPLVLPEDAEPAQAVVSPEPAPAAADPTADTAPDAALDAAPAQAAPVEAPPADTPEPPPAHD